MRCPPETHVYQAKYPTKGSMLARAVGIVLIAAGVLGEYIGKIYLEAKKRPRYHIEAAAGVFPGNPEE